MGNKDFAIKIWLEEVKYDVKFDSWHKSEIYNTIINNANTTNEKRDKLKVVNVQYDNDAANDWLCRQIQNAVDKIYGELAWCTKDDAVMDSDEIEENTPKEWTIAFSFSPYWRGKIRSMKSLCHRYVVAFTLANWYRAGGTEGWESYSQEAEACMKALYQEARSEVVNLEPWRF